MMGFWPARLQSRPRMSGDQSQPDPPEATGTASAAAPAVRWLGVEHASAVVEAGTAVGRWATVAGGVAEAALLLAARIWLSQTIFVHQIIMMMMMRADGFSAAPPVEATLIQSIAPLLLAAGLVTRPVALLLLLGLGQDTAGVHLASPQAILLIWLTIGGAGPLSLDHLLRGGLSRVPVWAVRWVSRLYAGSDALGELVLPLGTRIFLAIVIAGGTGLASWPVPFTGELVTAPWWTLLLCWALLLGLGTRPAALILCVVAPSIVLPSGVPDRFEVALLLLLLATKGAGRLSLDSAVTCIADSYLRMPSRDQPVPHVVVVGGGFGGIAAVRGLRWAACRITLIDRRNHYLFQPLLYQVATAALSPADIALPIRSVLRDQRNVSVRLGEVVGVDHAAREILLSAERIPFDFLILATGAQHSYFGRDEWAEYAPGLKSIEDATAMRSRMLLAFERAESEIDQAKREAWLTFVVVGGGPTGVELAGALAELARTGLEKEYRAIDPAAARVILVQSGPRVLPAFSSVLSAHAERSLRDLGVDVRTDAKVTRIDRGGVEIDGRRIAAQTTFWAAGVAASPAAKWLGQPGDKSGRVVVDGNLTVQGFAGVFAIGDTAASNGWAGAGVPGLAPAAKQQGRHAANVIRAAIKGYPRPRAFQYRHYGNLATIGRLAAVVEVRWLRLWGAPAWWLWGLAHVLLLTGGRNRATVVLNWLWAYLTYRRGTRLITGSTLDA
jgi:NADH:ubiquinone reductase (H+-translocating)